MFRGVFWVILPCKMIVDNHFTRQYNPEDSSEHHTRRCENLKSHMRMDVREIGWVWTEFDWLRTGTGGGLL
jgi:hypothetical protein